MAKAHSSHGTGFQVVALRSWDPGLERTARTSTCLGMADVGQDSSGLLCCPATLLPGFLSELASFSPPVVAPSCTLSFYPDGKQNSVPPSLCSTK